MFIACTSTGMWPTACTASQWKGMPRSRQRAPISGYRLDGADFVVGEHNGHESGVFPNGCFEILQTDDAVLVDIPAV